MDKRVILAVAGSGKTKLIVEQLSLDERALLITYTENNLNELRRRIVAKFGELPDNIRLFSYFSFLYSFSYKPFLSFEVRARGMYWRDPPSWTLKLPRHDLRYYLDAGRRLYHNRIAKLLDQRSVLSDVNNRVGKYFDRLLVDEVQDFAGHDFNFLMSLCKSELDILLVGDFFQHTFDTSRDGSTNRNLHKDVDAYLNRLKAAGLEIDTMSLGRSYRCSPSICDFINDHLGIEIESHREDETNVQIIDEERSANEVFCSNKIVKLFYQEHFRYPCHSQNWGASKGEDHYQDVCVVMSKRNFKLLLERDLLSLKPQTRNKLYVACSRAKGDLYFIRDTHIKRYKNL